MNMCEKSKPGLIVANSIVIERMPDAGFLHIIKGVCAVLRATGLVTYYIFGHVTFYKNDNLQNQPWAPPP